MGLSAAHGFIHRSSLIFALEISRYFHLLSHADAFLYKYIKISQYITQCKCLNAWLWAVCIVCSWGDAGDPALVPRFDIVI